MGQADIGVGAQHELAQGLKVSGAALNVNVGATIIGVDGMDRGTRRCSAAGVVWQEAPWPQSTATTRPSSLRPSSVSMA
ncbi:MAG: hypothetical protein ACLU37_11490 [Collinsella sp.]